MRMAQLVVIPDIVLVGKANVIKRPEVDFGQYPEKIWRRSPKMIPVVQYFDALVTCSHLIDQLFGAIGRSIDAHEYCDLNAVLRLNTLNLFGKPWTAVVYGKANSHAGQLNQHYFKISNSRDLQYWWKKNKRPLRQ